MAGYLKFQGDGGSKDIFCGKHESKLAGISGATARAGKSVCEGEGGGGGGRRSKTNLHQGVLIFLECLNMRKAYLLERADRCTSSVSVGFSKPDNAGPCVVLHSSDRPKHQQVPEPEAETLACLPRCQRKEKSPVTTDKMQSTQTFKGQLRTILFLHGKHKTWPKPIG